MAPVAPLIETLFFFFCGSNARQPVMVFFRPVVVFVVAGSIFRYSEVEHFRGADTGGKEGKFVPVSFLFSGQCCQVALLSHFGYSN